jgi:phospholipid/cholesterol/gamma-HCH transport system substrate-binding protein
MLVKNRTMEVLVGVFMVVGVLALFFLAMKVSNLAGSGDGEDGYPVLAHFANIGSLKVRAPVTLSGVRVGRVAAISIDRQTYEAVVTLNIYRQYDNIPNDTFANIFTAGLLGEQYIALEPGGSSDYLQAGDYLDNTQSALVLEQVIGQFLFGKAQEANGE